MSIAVVNVLLGEEALNSYLEGKLKLLSTISLLHSEGLGVAQVLGKKSSGHFF